MHAGCRAIPLLFGKKRGAQGSPVVWTSGYAESDGFGTDGQSDAQNAIGMDAGNVVGVVQE